MIFFFHLISLLPLSVGLWVPWPVRRRLQKLSRGKTISTPSAFVVLMYSFTPGSTWEMAS